MSSQVFRMVDFLIYRDFRNEYDHEDWWYGNINPDQTLYGPVETDDDDDDERPPPPFIVVAQGPPNVGKSLLIKSLVKYFISVHMNDIRGPITINTGKKTRLQFVECPDDINAMIDASKYADLVLFLVDASFEFEAETFEFLNLLQAHSSAQVMGVLTHLDKFNDENQLKETKERLQDHFRTEIHQSAKIHNLSGLDHDDLYKMCEIQELAEDVSMIQSRTLSWREACPYVLVDRFEDFTPLEEVQKDASCKRNISLHGYLRGSNINSGDKVHIAGVGDFRLARVTSSADPCPLSINMKEENVEIESFRRGTYIRLEVCNVPSGMVENFNPCHPILVGGISHEEENVGYMYARLKRHEWHNKLLKSRDAITVSAGWRRYQTKPIYSMEFGRLLKFTPEHDHCLAMFWGPLAPPVTKIALVQSTKEAFRVAAKGLILEFKPGMKIVKEIKQKGTPVEVFKRKTALINFTPETDVSKYKDQRVQTLSGIRGRLKKATTREGIAKCEFKYTIGMSDIFFMRVWRQVEAPRFFNPLSFKQDDPSQRREKGHPDGETMSTRNHIRSKLEPIFFRMSTPGRRRGVDIIDGEPMSYSCSSPLTVLYNIRYVNKNKKKIKEKRSATISEEDQKAYERRAEMLRRHRVEDEIPMEDGLPDMVLEHLQ